MIELLALEVLRSEHMHLSIFSIQEIIKLSNECIFGRDLQNSSCPQYGVLENL